MSDHNIFNRENLMKSCCASDIETAEKILRSGVSPTKNIDGMKTCQVMIESIKSGHLNIVKLLVSYGAPLNLWDMNGYMFTPLMTAIRHGHVDIVDYLLENIDKGIDLNEIGKYEHTAFSLACREERIDCIDRLIAAGCSVNRVKNFIDSEHPIISTLEDTETKEYICIDILDKLIVNGAKIQVHNKRRQTTPLYLAYRANRLKVVEKLLAYGYNGMKFQTDRDLALHACLDNKSEMLKIFLKYNMSLDVLSANDDTLLSSACSLGYIEIVKILLENNYIDINEKNSDGTTALMAAVSENNLEITKILIDYGADIKITDNDGDNAFNYAEDTCLNYLLQIKKKIH